TGEDGMKSRRVKVSIGGLLSLQLMVALLGDRPIEAHSRTHGVGSNASHTRLLPQPHRGQQPTVTTIKPNESKNASDHINYATLTSGILLNGRDWNGFLPDSRMPLNGALRSNGDLSSSCRAFFTGHLIKNAHTKTGLQEAR